ncbi:type-F conjugative transfer system pilin assembly protein TraF [Erwinia tasmaniensis]|uniref:TraF protein n=1 Tax=Erwinia tasmaniensis (strain DSM 17950 / CFBP 7177 / CIP 109463 / NCPPB 4357 / Et1/99) TaxID=465817 RepID=B2VB17_ERWT9|nr:type-F conjugative transfer system pilin assembly protein TraF [Erwinia tasmaniensis]CAO94965.1 TraF protein [Erwinia tasmaniensis Et1/99]
MARCALVGFISACFVFSNMVMADEVIDGEKPFTGWHWYNEPVNKYEAKKNEKPKSDIADISKMPIQEQVKVLQGYTKDALATAILYPHDIEANASFQRWQKFWTDHAGYFSQAFSVAQLKYPDLDYNLEHSHYNSIASLESAKQQSNEDKAIQKIAENYGLFLFYRGSDPVDTQMAGVVSAFAKAKNISIVPISVDGVVASTLPETRPDTGQSKAMRITHYPALYLVEPKSRKYEPVAYGFMTQDDLATRFMYVATGFKPNF